MHMYFHVRTTYVHVYHIIILHIIIFIHDILHTFPLGEAFLNTLYGKRDCTII